ncbi:MAG: ABC transporter ATP-binding protein [Clostridiales bacterium]|nr:ABC transporter ATP-binding protein [Clostridiales bacterium]
MIELCDVTKRYGANTAVDSVSFVVPEGELTVLLGPSGCGKTTLLRTINRMVEPDGGEVLIDGAPITASSPEELRRGIGYAIQSVGLFPHMTVARNIATVPRLLGWDAGRISARVVELLALVGLDPAVFSGKWPHELSGGEAQRVGVARALAADPPVLLMDEPFGALDPINRERLQREFAELHRTLGKTVVFVTHDIEEAVLLGDTIALMRDGRIVQSGSPEELWRAPASEFVRDFFGEEFGLRILARHRVGDLTYGSLAEEDHGAGTLPLPRVAPETSLRDALAVMVTGACDKVVVVDGQRMLGSLTFSEVVRGVRRAR